MKRGQAPLVPIGASPIFGARKFVRCIWLTAGLLLFCAAVPDTAARAAGHPLAPERRAALRQEQQETVERVSRSIEQDGDEAEYFSQRGDAYFFLGNFAKAVADYERMVELQPALETSHWRRGIAYFYARRYERAAHQFEIYHTFDDVDRENGIWRFFSQAKAYGLPKARQGLLKYRKDDREPFPSVYRLFAEETTPEKILRAIRAADIDKREREKRLFYAHLYVGLNHALHGRSDRAAEHLRQATANKWGPAAGFGPRYMWHVGRLHYELLTRFGLVSVAHDPDSLRGAHDIALEDGLAFVAGKFGAFAILDVSAPAHPRVLGAITEGVDNAETVLPMGDVCLLGTNDLLAVDVRDPTNPTILKRVADPRIDRINGMVRWGGRYVLAANKSGWIDVFDISDPESPTLHDALNTRKRGELISPHDLALYGDRLIVVDQRTGSPLKLRVYRIGQSAGELWPVADWKVEGALAADDLDGANRIAVGSRYAFVAANYSNTIGVVDLADPERPRQIANLPTADRDPDGMSLRENVLFIGCGRTVEAFDVSDPRHPFSLGHGRFAGLFPVERERDGAHDLAVDRNLVYVTAQGDHRVGILRFRGE